MSIKVRWEGSLTANHSLAVVNRAIVAGLLRGGVRVETYPQQEGPYRLDKRVSVRATSGDVDVTVRHQWPPDLSSNHKGRLVLWQPWEFGAVPQAWADFAIDVADEVWCYTHFVEECYLAGGVPQEKLHLVPLGVDLSRFRPEGRRYPLPEAATTFLFVGGTISRKGIDVLLSSYVAGFENRDDVLLVVKGFGSGSFYKGTGIRELVASLERARPIAPRVLYLEEDLSDDDLASLYRSADALIHPYRGEGYALPVAEAMASGVPVLTTLGGSTDDFFIPGAGTQIPAERVTLNPAALGLPAIAGQAWWLEPNAADLITAMRAFADDPGVRVSTAKAVRSGRHTLSWDAGAAAALERVRALV